MIILQSLDQGFVNGEVFYFVLDFDLERVLLQPANSQSQDLNKVPLLLKTFHLMMFFVKTFHSIYIYINSQD